MLCYVGKILEISFWFPLTKSCSGGSRISKRKGANSLFGMIFAENRMKWKKIDWARSLRPLDSPLDCEDRFILYFLDRLIVYGFTYVLMRNKSTYEQNASSLGSSGMYIGRGHP